MKPDQTNSETTNPFSKPQEPTTRLVTDRGEANPYQSPHVPTDPIPYHRRRIIVAVVLGVLTLPAAVVVFFVTCVASAVLLISITNRGFVYPIALFVGAACAISTIFMMYKLIKRTLQKPPTDRGFEER